MGTAPNEELCLRWNDFESILSRSFSEMRDESDFFDVRVACFDEKSVMKTLPAHRVVLSACSPVFKELLRVMGRTGDSKGPLIFLRGISYHEMEAVLDFMYNGQTKVQHTDLDAFLAAAEELKIKGLTTNTGQPGGASGGSGSNESTSGASRKRPSMQHESDGFDNGLKVKIKKSKPTPNVAQAGPSSAGAEAESAAGNMVVKSEEVTLDVEDDSYQDYAEAELEEPFDESAYQDHDGTGADNFPTDSKDTLSRKEWLKRMEVHIIRELDKYRCGLCFKLFTRKDSLQSHFEHFHTSSRYPCEYCGQIFESRNNRRVHYHKQHYEEHKYRRQAEQQNEQQSSH